MEVQLTWLLGENEVLTLAKWILVHLIFVRGVIIVGQGLLRQTPRYEREVPTVSVVLRDLAEIVSVIERIPVKV